MTAAASTTSAPPLGFVPKDVRAFQWLTGLAVLGGWIVAGLGGYHYGYVGTYVLHGVRTQAQACTRSRAVCELSLWLRVLEIVPGDREARVALCPARARHGNPETAVTDCDAAIALLIAAAPRDPQLVDLYAARAAAWERRSEPQRALDDLQRCADFPGADRTAWLTSRARLYERLGDKEAALREGGLAISARSSDVTAAHELRLGLLLGMGRLTEALADLDGLVAARSLDVGLRVLRGRLRLRVGLVELARADFAVVLQLNVRDARGHIGIGDVEVATKHPDQAVASYRAALKIWGRSPSAGGALTEILISRGKVQEALKLLKNLEGSGLDAEALYRLARAEARFCSDARSRGRCDAALRARAASHLEEFIGRAGADSRIDDARQDLARLQATQTKRRR